MNRAPPIRLVIFAFTAAVGASAALASDQPQLSIEPLVARNLLAPLEEERPARSDAQSYRLGEVGEQAAGRGARLTLPVGDTTVFAITGKLQPRNRSASGDLRNFSLSSRRESGKVYGAGIERRVGPVDLSATYQFSKVTAGHPEVENAARISSGGRSHSLRATARIRFRN